jgi:hypothetical protein
MSSITAFSRDTAVIGSGTLSAGATTLDTVAVAEFRSAQYLVTLINGEQRYQSTIDVVRNSATTADITESSIVVSDTVTTVPVTFDADISGGNLRLIATATSTGWGYRLRRIAAQPL